MRERSHLWIALLVGAIASAPALLNAPVYDDEVLIFSNTFAHGTAHLTDNLTRDFFYASGSGGGAMGYYRPIMKAAFSLEYGAFGRNVLGYHLTSIAAWLCVIAIGAALARRSGVTAGVIGVGAVLCASHPVCASAVGTITSQSDLFVAVAMLASGYGYLRWRDGASPRWLVFALMAEALALGCKEVAVLTPALIVAAELSRSRVIAWRACLRREVLAFALLVAIYGVLRVWLQVMPVRVERSGGELGALVTASKLACSALLRAFAPTAWMPLLHPERPEPTIAAVATWLVPALGLLAASCVLFVRRAEARMWIVLLWTPLLPLMFGESMIHTTNDAGRITIPDRWLVLSALAASFGVAALVMLARARLRRPLQLVVGALIGVLVLVQGLITFEETSSYASENTHVVHVAALYREHGMRQAFALEVILAAEGIVAESRNDARGAVHAYARLVELAPGDVMRRYNLAVALMRAGKTQDAYAQAYAAYLGTSLDGSVQLQRNDSWNRRRPERAFLLAQLAEQLGDGASAARYYGECISMRPDFPSAREAMARLGQAHAAVDVAPHIVTLTPQ